jgi:sugar lactone lactonase YvrE
MDVQPAPRRRRAGSAFGIACLALIGYLAAWPTPIDPAAWQPPAAPAPSGAFAPNQRLAPLEPIAAIGLAGPEYIEVDAAGRLYAGFIGGKVMRFAPDGSEPVELALISGGRPLGLRVMRDGGLIVADARRGLLRVDGKVRVLADRFQGEALQLVDDVVVDAQERSAYFTEASHKFGLDGDLLDILEHGANGRLFRYDLEQSKLELMLDQLHFANGLAFGPGQHSLLLTETSSYRVRRYWLDGARAGQNELFADNLPGFPDNITFNGTNRFWVALANPRNGLLDRLAPYPFLRKVVARLPSWLRPQPVRHGLALALDLDGRPVSYLEDSSPDAYAPLTTVREAGSWLYFGSLSEPSIGRLPLAQALPQP